MDPLRRFQLSLLPIVGLLVIGTAGYIVLEHMSLLDAVYMTVITLSTVGYGEVQPLHPVGKIFTIALIISAVGVFAWALGNAVQLLFGEELRERVRRLRMEQTIARLQNHYIVCGYGRVGRAVTHEFRQRRVPFVVVDRDLDEIRHLQSENMFYVQGDASSDEVLDAAGIKQARGLMAVIDSDAGNLLIVLTAHTLNPRLRIVARAAQPDMENKLRLAGAEDVLSPYEIGGRRLAIAALYPTLGEFLETIIYSKQIHTETNATINELMISPGSSLAGKTIEEAKLRREWGIVVIGIKTGKGEFVISPPFDYILAEGDTLLALARREKLHALVGMRPLS